MNEFTCWECGHPTEYEGNGYWHCPICHLSFYEGVDDDEIGERLNVWDAAAIWRSHGKDEDYMFGYSEEELEKA